MVVVDKAVFELDVVFGLVLGVVLGVVLAKNFFFCYFVSRLFKISWFWAVLSNFRKRHLIIGRAIL